MQKTFVFNGLKIYQKVLLVLVVILPFLIISITYWLINRSIEQSAWVINQQQGTVLSAQVSGPTAKITIFEPNWISNGQVYDKSKSFPGTSLTDYYAPLPIFFQGLDSTPREDIVSYDWDFGDNNSYQGNPNTFSGFNAAHVYEKPGNYIATLKVTDKLGKINTTNSINITVKDRDGRKFWVDANLGNDTWTGLCKEKETTSNCGPWKTATKAFKQMENWQYVSGITPRNYLPGDEIIFKRGQTFEISTSTRITHYRGGYGYIFRADEGNGAKPVIQYTGTGTDHLINQIGYDLGHIAFIDLIFNLRSPKNVSAGGLIYNAGRTRNILLLRVEGNDPKNGFFTLQGSKGTDMTGLFVFDSKIKNNAIYSNSNTLGYYYGSNLAIINSTFDLAGNHVAYLAQVDKGVISGSTFSRPAYGRTALRLSQKSNNVQISNNKFLGWIDPNSCSSLGVSETCAHNGQGKNYNYQLVSLAPNDSTFQDINNIIFERNILTNCQNCLNIADANNITIKNNIIFTPDKTPTSRIEIGAAGSINHSIPSRNIYIYGNTIVSGGTTNSNSETALIKIIDFVSSTPARPEYGSGHSNINIMNNILAYSEGSSGRFLRVSKLESLIPIKSDRNLYYLPVSSSLKAFQIGYCQLIGGKWDCLNRKLLSINEWQNLNGKEVNSLLANPRLTSWPILISHQPGQPVSLDQAINEANSIALSVKPAFSSQALNFTINKYDHYLYNDFTGKIRPYNGALDLGAYQITANVINNETVTTTGAIKLDIIPEVLVEWNLNIKTSNYFPEMIKGNHAYCQGSCPNLNNDGLFFDNTSGYLKSTTTLESGSAKGFTVTIFGNAQDRSLYNSLGLISTQSNASTQGFRFLYRDYGKDDRLYLNIGGKNDYGIISSSTCYNAWCHYAFTYSPEGTAKIYLNGKIIKTITGLTPNLYIKDKINIGKTININNEKFKGLIKQAKIFNKVLSEEEILKLSQNP